MDYKPDMKIQCLIEGDNTNAMSLTTGVFLTQISGVLQNLAPDMVLIHGDRYEMLSVAIAASYNNIPLIHTEGGETTGTIDEKVRHSISQLANIHFPVTELAKEKLLAMGCDPSMVHVVGSTALDSLVGIDLSNNRTEPYIVVLQHPNTTDPEPIEPLIEALRRIHYNKVWVNHNVDAGNKAMLKLIHKEDVEFVKNLPPEEYARLIYNSKCLIGNTSSGIKEGAFLGVPYICVGNRQQGREKGNNVLRCLNDKDKIYEALKFCLNINRPLPDYRFGDGTAAQKIVKILAEVEL
jgi:UDP-hydrolysing UDP-N-acetyl-D-glucosamine 2-epimerase